jgi:hypothetical protein
MSKLDNNYNADHGDPGKKKRVLYLLACIPRSIIWCVAMQMMGRSYENHKDQLARFKKKCLVL